MTYSPLTYPPGVCLVDSQFAASQQISNSKDGGVRGRITNMEGSRFVAGFPEKLKGWNYAYSTTGGTSGVALNGVPRGLKDWRDNSSNVYLGIGTHEKLYVFFNGSATEITPLRAIQTGTLTNAFVTTSNSAVVTVLQGTHGQQTGDYIQLVAAGTVGGISPQGVFNPITSLGTNSYSFVNSSVATSAGTGGGTIAYTYYRTTLTNPFTTTSNSTTVKVTQGTNGASAGDFVTISGGTSVGGITLSGEYQIQSIIDINDYTITALSTATAGVTGGGTPNFQYNVPTGNQNAMTSYGYGDGGYGEGGYGESTIGTTLPPRVWALSPYGAQLLCSYYGGTLYIYDPTITGGNGRAYPMYGAPATLLWSFVTAERFVFALGINGILMEMAWPDQSNYNTWISTPTNTANSGLTLQAGSYLIAGLPVATGVSMVFTNRAAYTFTYSGDNFVYDNQIAADGAGLIGPLACNTIGGIAFWMGNSEFWTWNGTVAPMGSDDIRDYVFQNINLAQSFKFVCATNISKKEVWFFYVSSAASEIDSYVIYHLDQSCWSKGTVLQRTSWIDRGLFPTPIATDANGYIYNQESGTDAAGQALNSYIEYSPVSIAEGEMNQDVFSFIPDFERNSGNISLTVLSSSYPQDTPTVNGPYTIGQSDANPRIDLRIGAKLIGYEITSDQIGGDWRMGVHVVESQPAGARR